MSIAVPVTVGTLAGITALPTVANPCTVPFALYLFAAVLLAVLALLNRAP